MIDKLIACTSNGKVLNFKPFKYQYPEDWELVMDPTEKWLNAVFIPKGYKIGCITYDYTEKAILYICIKEVDNEH